MTNDLRDPRSPPRRAPVGLPRLAAGAARRAGEADDVRALQKSRLLPPVLLRIPLRQRRHRRGAMPRVRQTGEVEVSALLIRGDALDAIKLTAGFSDSFGEAFRCIQFPYFYYRDGEFGESCQLSTVLADAVTLRGVSWLRIDARIGMPIGAVHLKDGANVGKPEINHKLESAKCITKDPLALVRHTNERQLSGDSILQLGHLRMTTIRDSARRGLRHLSQGLRRMAIASIRLACDCCFLLGNSRSLPPFFRQNIGGGDQVRNQAGTTDFQITSSRAGSDAMFGSNSSAFRSAESTTADNASHRHASLTLPPAQGIRTRATTSRLPSKLQSSGCREVFRSAVFTRHRHGLSNHRAILQPIGFVSQPSDSGGLI